MCRSSFDYSPWTMADHCHRLARIEEGLHKVNRLRLHPQLVRIHHAAWQQQRIEFLHPSLLEVHINIKFVTPIPEVPAADMFAFGRHDARCSAGLVESLSGLDQFDLLETVLNQYCYFQSFKNLHRLPPQ